MGITGSMASGKSTVLNILNSEYGFCVISSDEIVRKLQQPGRIFWRFMKKNWGDEFIKEDSSIDRRKMAARLLEKKSFREQVENFTHPVVLKKINEKFKEWQKKGCRAAAAEVPLLFEAGGEGMFDVVLLLFASEKELVKRIKEERDVDEKDAGRWLKIQMPQEEKKRRADFILDGGEPLDKEKERLKEIMREILEEK